ncbi:putative homeodomain transcription factor [Nasonia vitripennis]|uniref:PHTF1/2 N-terminal domain-containing protein n=1 Tax=Nasonia vitripennis TaxID=7425 RepID=A0A7M7LS80_NASVI|nr:putative homeodomain transcription factor [Nasonia vitripennis]XP_008216638.1 putative homeodomain transcription factor [Nasonia vitripennis]XP_008216639.1 putative homeodomain transcription factor [Nasonia vitripennis]XP_031783347.1 putative homeodomain transcription factor [Nasonia vitripennis]
MALNKLVYWYQKKIGTYDRQEWEDTVEQKIFCGLTHVPMRAAKLKTELIDVDLVRGSSFPKAKPKHGLGTVVYLAIQRLLFLPYHAQWWIHQTSFRIYILFILLYGLQMLNLYIFFNYFPKENESDIITISEVITPAVMMLILCLVHSQIVSTNSGPILSIKYDRQRIRRSRQDRSRLNKTRARRNIRSDNEDAKTCQDATADTNSKVDCEASPSVRFTNKVIIDKQTIILDTKSTIKDSREPLSNSRKTQLANSKSIIQIQSVDIKDHLAPEISIINTDLHPSEEDNCDSPGSGNPSIQSSKSDKKECESEEEGECEEAITNHLLEATSSATEWMGVTTNSDECSYSSEFEESDCQTEANMNHEEYMESPFAWEFELPQSMFLSSGSASADRVSCTIWTSRDIKKAELSALDISSAIIERVESMPESIDYFYAGLVLAVVLSLVPSLRRVSDHLGIDPMNNTASSLKPSELSLANSETIVDLICKLINVAFGSSLLERILILSSALERLVLASLLFFLLAVAERTYKQRLLYAKLFSHLTSSRRARKSNLPHFRLNKVRNIKTWLSVRSYLKRRGPQRSVDVIVSSVFIITLALLSFVSLELIKDLNSLHSHYNIEALFWSFALGIFILRFMTLGTKINKKYRNISVLITEQINLYLQIEQKPHKKEELMIANSVLKLAADLIKELESPFKISGLSANPYLYTITKVILLSALSGVLSELLGFKLKLHKIKIK